ncbi:MAG: alkaline phosphatase D family protein [Burkholderiales bacterium]|nr:alkaline phosphatase D family protein [Burkholderiales bacterium]
MNHGFAAGRRYFLQQAGKAASLLLPAGLVTAASKGEVSVASSKLSNKNYPFSLGVASGCPRQDSVVLWTRILPDPLQASSSGVLALNVRWEVANDEGFTQIVKQGKADAVPQLAHSVHVEVTGLQPERWYWYRFMLGDAISPIGRTRTAPAPASMPAHLKIAAASCQHWEFGSYCAHQHIANAQPDLVAFLGDYIYEWGPYALQHPKVAQRSDECFDLAQYRARYAQYKSDPQLQAAHLAAPWLMTWDDHEVANDYANLVDERLDRNFAARRAAAYQAYYEHMPLPPSVLMGQQFTQMRIFGRYDWGRLARFYVLDDRQFRATEACPKPGQGGSNSVTSACRERLDPKRSILGTVQEAWLKEELTSSKANWNIVLQQTLMAQNSQVPAFGAEEGRFWTDGWDGYPHARARLLRDIAASGVKNPIVLSGDVHTFYASELVQDFHQAVSKNNPIIATEFCGTSITSTSRPQARTERYMQDNPHTKFGRSDLRGFMLLDITPQQTTNTFVAMEDVTRSDSLAKNLARFVLEDGKIGVHKA